MAQLLSLSWAFAVHRFRRHGVMTQRRLEELRQCRHSLVPARPAVTRTGSAGGRYSMLISTTLFREWASR